MPRLLQLLRNQDPATLEIIADYWGIVDQEISPEMIAKEILANFRSPESNQEIIEALSKQAQSAWKDLLRKGGRESWAIFSRQHGDIRSMGASRIQREKPQLNPENGSEALWYRGMLGRMFLDQKPEPQEVAFIPDELLKNNAPFSNSRVLNKMDIDDTAVQALPPLVLDTLNDLTTILASVRTGGQKEIDSFLFQSDNYEWMFELLITSGMLSRNGSIDAEKVKSWFDQPPGEMLASLIDSWYSSGQFNELRLIPQIECEGSWKNDPKTARIFTWNSLKLLLENSWIPVDSFIEFVHTSQPDFQRPAGNYDLWMIRDKASNNYLRGFENWSQIEGRFLHFILATIMPALGLIELGIERATRKTVFRWSDWGKQYLQGKVGDLRIELPRNTIRSQGDIRLEPGTPFPLRYQLSRFCKWITLYQRTFQFRIGFKEMQSAQINGMEVKHIHSILTQLFGKLLPPTLTQAIDRLDQSGCMITGENVSLLRVASSQILSDLLKSEASRYLGEQLNPLTIVVRKGMENQLEKSILESGYFSDFHLEV